MSKPLDEIKARLVANFNEITKNREIEPCNIEGFSFSYLNDYNMNLYENMPSDVINDFSQGNGKELLDTPAKMKAKYSSSAFAVNLFGYDKVKIVKNDYEIPVGEYYVEYEKQFPTIKSSNAPANIDVCLSNDECEVYLEVKLTEPIDKNKQECSKSYLKNDNYDRISPILGSEFIKLFEKFNDLKSHQYDAMQMLKHLLGICNTMDKRQGKKVFLINCHCANAILDDANSDFQVMGDNYIKDVAKICDACGVKVMNLNHKEMMAIMDIEEGRRKYVEARYNLE